MNLLLDRDWDIPEQLLLLLLPASVYSGVVMFIQLVFDEPVATDLYCCCPFRLPASQPYASEAKRVSSFFICLTLTLHQE